MKPIPESLAERAVNQYRKRDALSYVGLRHYLRNRTALREEWAMRAAHSVTRMRRSTSYHVVPFFKEERSDGSLDFRYLHIPGPNEILAETALISACAQCGDSFKPHPLVFSYLFPRDEGDGSGIYRPYYEGFSKRHAAIAAAAGANPEGVVVYTDIRKYYPSITIEAAQALWDNACAEGGLAAQHCELGRKLLSDYARFAQKGKLDELPSSLPTGPMLCHLIGNLRLRELDTKMAGLLPEGYFRYVDDIALAGSADKVRAAETALAAALSEVGLTMNPTKRIEVRADEWLESAGDFESPAGHAWRNFVAELRNLLLVSPWLLETIALRFHREEIRIRPVDYSEVAQERPVLERMENLMNKRWFRKLLRRPHPVERLLGLVRAMRTEYAKELRCRLDSWPTCPPNSYSRKRTLYRIRFLVARIHRLA